MLEHQKVKIQNSYIQEMSYFVDVIHQSIDEAKDQYREKIEKKRLSYLVGMGKIREDNHKKLLVHNNLNYMNAYLACKSLDSELSKIIQSLDSLNQKFYIYNVEGENYFSPFELDFDQIIEDPYSSSFHALVGKTWGNPETKRHYYNNQSLYNFKATTLSRILLQEQWIKYDKYGKEIHINDYLLLLKNLLISIKKSGISDWKLDLSVSQEFKEVIKLNTPDILPEIKFSVEGKTLSCNSLLKNSAFLNDCIINDLFYIEKDFDIILAIAKDVICKADLIPNETKDFGEAIKTIYLLLKLVDGMDDRIKIDYFDKIHYFYDMKSYTKIYNKIFENKETMVLYKKLEKDLYPRRYAYRLQQERVSK